MKKRIAVSQRVVEHQAYAERRDCLDQRWMGFLEQAQLTPVPMPNCLSNVVAWLRSMEIDGLLLTGGNDLATVPNCTSPAPERDRTEFAAIDHCLASDIPILGVCRGLQILGVHAGAQLTTVSNHVATRHTLRSDTDLFPAEVNSYHTLQIQPSTLGQTVQACAFSDDGTIEALADEGFQRVGIMWHPEREESTSLNDIKLFKKVFRVEK